MYKIKYLIFLLNIVFLATCVPPREIFAGECQAVNKGIAVVELFTSEGCSDCPEADKVLNEISKFDSSKNVYPLAFHVTYWDYIGWKDNFGKEEFTNRQGMYSRIFRERNYTPQAVVNGRIDIVGSRRDSLHSSIDSELGSKSTSSLELTTNRKGKILEVKYKASCISKNQVINFAIVEKGIISTVTSGENAGKTLQHENVVRIFKAIPISKNSGTIKLEFPGIEKKPTSFELIAFLQDITTLAITGAIKDKIN